MSAKEKKTINIEGMHCAACVTRVEKALSSVDGVDSAAVNLLSNSAQIIFDSSAKGKLKKIPYAEIRFLPKNYATPAATNIYGNKVAIINWTENPLAILINNKEIADSYRKYFEILWKSAKDL